MCTSLLCRLCSARFKHPSFSKKYTFERAFVGHYILVKTYLPAGNARMWTQSDRDVCCAPDGGFALTRHEVKPVWFREATRDFWWAGTAFRSCLALLHTGKTINWTACFGHFSVTRYDHNQTAIFSIQPSRILRFLFEERNWKCKRSYRRA